MPPFARRFLLLFLFVLPFFSYSQPPCSELFFSEYIEGSGSEKALEIFNPTPNPVVLDSYSVSLFSNGSTNPTTSLNLRGILQPYDVYVINNSSATLSGIVSNSDTTSQVCNFNGDDAVGLFRTGNLIDVIGEIGVDPGSSWPVGTGSTVNRTLIRADTVTNPESNWAIGATEWVVNGLNTDSLIGYHLSTCGGGCPPLFANFTAVDSALQVRFTDASVVFPSAWSWDFGDGNNSLLQDPIHVYSQPGTYQVCLIISNSCAPPDTLCDSIEVILPPPPCQELFFSEYFEGSSSNRFVEIYNPTASAVNLSGYSVELYSNGASSPTNTQALTGTLASHDVFVISNSSASLPSINTASNLTSAICNFTGDDALALRKNGAILDVIGEIGVDPGSSWPVGSRSTVNSTLVRADTVQAGTPFWSAGQNQWEVYPSNTDTFIDFHNSICATGCTIAANFSSSANLTTVQFTDLSGGGATSWFWDFGDASTSTQQSPSHTYANPGTYTVCLIATAPCGSDTLCQNVTVTCPQPTVAFTPTANGLTQVFTDQSQPGVTGWFWDFGDGNTSSLQNPSHTYAAPGTYNVCLTVISPCGSGFGCQSVTVTCPAPVAGFQHSVNLFTAQFTNQSTGTNNSYFWDFGDGNTSNQANPSHTYSQNGTYTVCLIAQNICGADTSCNSVTISCPVAQAAFSSTNSGLSASFTDLSSNTPASWLWDFGDGNTSIQQNPTHSYVQPGTYTVCLTVTNACGSDSTCSSLVISCASPVAAFSSSSNFLTAQFSDLSTGGATSWLWDFGDGNTSTQQNPSHTYAQAGTYTVCLTATSICGSDSSCQSVQITCPVPQAIFSSSNSGLTVSFTDQSINAPTTWLWDFGDGNTSGLSSPTHTYAQPGTYTVCLTVSGLCGSDSSCASVVVTCPAPVAGFSSTSTLFNAQFTDQSTGGATSWAWDFGDGNTSTLQNPTHTYAQVGTYTVCLITSSLCGADTSCQSVTISCPVPQAIFTNSNSGLAVTFTDQSINTPTTWAWDFGDGNTSALSSPSHTYALPGTYTVCLTVSGACGSDTTCTNLIVSCPAPVAAFGSSVNQLNVQFTDQSTTNPTSWFWDFGDGNTSTSQSPSHSYSQSGTYTVCLVASSLCGSDTLCQNITALCPVPGTNFTSNSSGLTVQFIDLTSNAPASWAWDFGDGNSSTQQNPTHSYAQVGSYVVCLTTTNSCGSDTNCVVVNVSCPAPQAFFSSSSNNLTASFNDLSSNSPTNWAWSFGDGNFSTMQNPSHSYSNPGSYTVCLVASSPCGSDTSCAQVVVNCQTPTANFFFGANSNLQVSFTDASSNGPAGWLWDFGDGNTSTQASPNHTYAMPGLYTVCLTVNNGCGNDSLCRVVNVNCPAPAPAFIWSGSFALMQFDDQSINNPTSWSWDFGDGNTSTQQNPTHSYSGVGVYTVCLTVTNACGTQTLCQQVTAPVSNQDALKSTLSLSPNPSTGRFRLRFDLATAQLMQIRISDLQGKVLWKLPAQRMSSYDSVIDLGSLAKGMYLLEINSEEGKVSKRLIIE